ncbi:MAG: RNA polymerase sigma factor [Pirellulaceae bacterium]|nr:RNA polymerase sigma factor [Pirellulaceae bacterium]
MNASHLVRRLADGDLSSPGSQLEGAFARYQGELLGTLYFLVGNREDARDALQEAFLKCWRNRHKLPELDNLKAWIFRVALNTGRDMRQAGWRRRREPWKGETMIDSVHSQPAAQAEQREQLGRLRDAVRQLRPEEQEVFLLRQNGQLTYDEIAQAIGIPLGTVKTRMRLALSRLRLVLNDLTTD